MSNHEEGEIEFVLGNKQLLSVFVLVVMLLGIFFAMGYVVGRNTAPASTLTASNKQPPIVVESAGRPPLPDVTKPSASVKEDPKKGTTEPPPAVTPPPVEPPKVAKSEPPPAPPKPEPAKPKPEPPPVAAVKPKPEPVKPEPSKPEPPKPAPTTVAKGKGTFLQVVATKRPDAEKVVATLNGKGFSASIMPVPDSTLVRVVVGPVGDDSVSRTRSGLEAAGYKPIVRKF